MTASAKQYPVSHFVPFSTPVSFPSSIVIIRSANSNILASCVTMTMQRLSFRMFWCTKLRMFRPVSPSRDAVGSSNIRISGWLTMARAIATRCCSPPLNLTGGKPRPALQADDFEVAQRLVHRLIPVTPFQDQRNRHVFERRQSRKQVIVLEHEADRIEPESRDLVVAQIPDVRILHHDAARIRPQYSRDHAQQRRLAAAGRPDDEKYFAVVGLEAHALDRIGPGFTFPEPLDEFVCPDCRMRHV